MRKFLLGFVVGILKGGGEWAELEGRCVGRSELRHYKIGKRWRGKLAATGAQEQIRRAGGASPAPTNAGRH